MTQFPTMLYELVEIIEQASIKLPFLLHIASL
jgi:hypothetical protein